MWVIISLLLISCGDVNNPEDIIPSEYTYVAEYVDLEVEAGERIVALNLNNDQLIYLKQKDKSRSIHFYDFHQLEETSINYESALEDGYVLDMSVNHKGEVAVLEQGDTFLEDSHQYQFNNVVQVIGQDASILHTIDLSKAIGQFADRDTPVWIYDILYTDQGDLYVSTEETIYVIDQNSNMKMEIASGSASIEINLGTTQSGEIFSIQENDGLRYYEIDSSTGELSRGILAPELIFSIGNVVLNDDLTILLSDRSDCFRYHIETGEKEVLFSWRDTDVLGEQVLAVGEVKEDRLYVVINDSATGIQEIVFLEKILTKELEEKTTVYLACLSLHYEVERSVILFNREQDQYQIKVKEYLDDEAYRNEEASGKQAMYDAALLRFYADISGGNPPDLIQFHDGYLSVETMLEQGVLEEVSLYLSENGYEYDDFVASILEELSFEGGLYYLPSKFRVLTVFADKSIVGSDMGWTLEEALEIASTIPEEMEFLDNTPKILALSWFLDYGYQEFVEEETALAKFDTEIFQNLLEVCNTFPSQRDYSIPAANETPSLLQNGKLLLYDTGLSKVHDYHRTKEYFRDIEVTAIGYPQAPGNGSSLNINNGLIGIHNESEYKEVAAEFLFFCLEDDVEYADGFSVIQTEFEEQLSEVTEEDRTVIRSILEGAQFQKNTADQIIIDIVLEEAEVYFEGGRSVEEVVTMIQNRVSLYLAETN